MTDFLSLGEIMLRLKSPAHERFFQSPQLEATFGGGEANVAVSLSNYGLNAGFVSALPDNDIGEGAIRELRKFGVDTSRIVRQGEAGASLPPALQTGLGRVAAVVPTLRERRHRES